MSVRLLTINQYYRMNAFSLERVITGFLQVADEQVTGEGITKSASSFELVHRTRHKDLNVEISFGQGRATAVPWIAFIGYQQKIQHGIYPVYLYYKSRKTLILAYGVSDTNKPTESWPDESQLTSIRNYFQEKGVQAPERYGSSFVYEIYDTSRPLDFLKMDADLEQIIRYYHTLYSGNGNHVQEPYIPYNEKKRSMAKKQLRKGRNYWWLNANPGIWRISEFQVDQEQTYTSYNSIGNKRRKYEYFEQVKPGDWVIGYATTPLKKVVASFEITEALHLDEDEGKELISFRIKEFFPYQISWAELLHMSELADSEVIKNNQGSLFKLTEAEYQAIEKKANNTDATLHHLIYDKETALSELFLDVSKLDRILKALSYKKNLILQGPPGTGKTFLAKRLAYLKLGRKDPSKIQMIQFHQSYAYEDFIQGYRPNENGGFELKNGVFYEFCLKAQRDPEHDYFFIIDEINRGNLGKVFGELMMLIEHDKRGVDFALPLTYARNSENPFYIPSNLYLIGTMNTADRSLAMVDYALRRRFAFINIEPELGDNFIQHLTNKGLSKPLAQKVVAGLRAINQTIRTDRNLGSGFALGHSYFCGESDVYDKIWCDSIVENEIKHLLNEYWFDDNEKVEQQIQSLLA